MRTETKVRRVLLAGLAVIALASCGGGGGGGDEQGNEVPGLVTIEEPTESPIYTTASDEVLLSGSRSDGVFAVSWSNAAGGGGQASLSSEQCHFFSAGPFTCNTEWGASIPLVVGANAITVTGSGANGNWGRATITVTRVPESWPPAVTSTSPANGADSVAPENIRLLATFSERIDPNSGNSSAFILKDGSENPVHGTVQVTNGGNSAEFRPLSALANSMSYTAVVTTGIKDLAGHTMAADYSWTFVTAAR